MKRPPIFRSRGFTLVELIMVMVLTGIIAALVSGLLKPVIGSYVDMARRAAMTDMADIALKRIGRDIRAAVPNSIRWPNNQCIELLPSSTGGRYRMAPDTVNGGSATLDITQAVIQFDVLSEMSAVPAAGDWVVIGNQNTGDVYAGINRAAISSVTTPATTVGLSRITLNTASFFPGGYNGGRFVVVSNNGGNPAVSYICSGADGSVDASGNGKGTLYRLTRPFSASYPTSCPATAGAAILATNLKSCNFVYNPNQDTTQQSALVWIQLELTQANETIALAYGAHVDNVP
ncbi:MAG: type II secretion system protein J [Bacteroidota bacterium]